MDGILTVTAAQVSITRDANHAITTVIQQKSAVFREKA